MTTKKPRKPPTIGSSGSKASSSGAFPVVPKRKTSASSAASKSKAKPKASAPKKPVKRPAKPASPKKTRSTRSRTRGGSRGSRGGRGGGSSLIRKAFKAVFMLGLVVGVIGAMVLGFFALELPSITRSATFERQSSITVMDSSGSVIARYGEMKGDTISVQDMPPHLIHAVMATEDRRFYSHFGIDVIGLVRAAVVNMRAGGVVQGGSTITQQLAKNLFLTHERTYKRKIQEAMLALWLERKLSKDEILTAYLNRVYLGSGTYGIDAAANLYFDKSVKDLTLRESAIIAGLLKAPSRFSPRRNPNLANERADVVLQAMVEAGYITSDEAKGISNVPPRPPQRPEYANSVRYYTDWVVDGLDDLVGTPDTDLIVETAMVSDIQSAAEKALFEVLSAEAEERNIGQGAVVVMAHDGAVLGLVGGRDYNRSQFNRIVQAKRQPGSAFKPFVYLAGLEFGMSPDTQMMDEPFRQGRYRPTNYGNKYYGLVTMDEALTLSLNTTAVLVTREVTPDRVIDTARRMGIISNMEPDLSLALGSYAVSPLELTTAYAALANGGHAVFPYAITRVRDESGKVYYERPQNTVTRRVADEFHVRQMQAMLQNVVLYGTGQGAKQGFPVSGKTGTSQESRDAWFAGFSDRLVTTVWIGNDDNSPTKGVTGGSTPVRIWSRVMAASQHRFTPRRTFSLSSEEDLIAYQAQQQGGLAGGFQQLLGRLLPTAGGGSAGGAGGGFSGFDNVPQQQQQGQQQRRWGQRDGEPSAPRERRAPQYNN
ncbi:MAG: transglycosylase domain-containing protein [Alphaproteobacteria bacterium]